MSVPLTRNYTFEAGSSEYLLHFYKGGKAIGIGSAAEAPATDQNGLVTVGWPMKLTDGFLLRETDGSSKYTPITSASQLGGGTSIDSSTDLQVKSLRVGSGEITIPNAGGLTVSGQLSTSSLTTNGISFLTSNNSPSLSTTYFLPVQIVSSVPTTNIKRNVIYFVKSST